jgi:hypothetical protein
MVEALSFSPLLKAGRLPTPSPRVYAGAAQAHARCAPHLAARSSMFFSWTGAGCRCAPWQHTRRVRQRTALLCPLRRRFSELRLISFRRCREVNDSYETTAHGPVKGSRFLPGVWRLVIEAAIIVPLPKHRWLPVLMRNAQSQVKGRRRLRGFFFVGFGPIDFDLNVKRFGSFGPAKTGDLKRNPGPAVSTVSAVSVVSGLATVGRIFWCIFHPVFLSMANPVQSGAEIDIQPPPSIHVSRVAVCDVLISFLFDINRQPSCRPATCRSLDFSYPPLRPPRFTEVDRA